MIERYFVPKEPPIVPPLWRRERSAGKWLTYVRPSRITPMSLILGGERHDGRDWLHMSLSTPGRCPTWNELVEAKRWALGVEARAIAIVPPDAEYVNINPSVLHLWQPLGAFDLPDFRRPEPTLGGKLGV